MKFSTFLLRFLIVLLFLAAMLQCTTVYPSYLSANPQENAPELHTDPLTGQKPLPLPPLTSMIPVETVKAIIVNEGVKLNPAQQKQQAKAFADYPVLGTLFIEHGIEQLPPAVQTTFINLFLKTRETKYLPKDGKTYCTTFFYDYFTEIGYGDLLAEIKGTAGKTMIEKTLNFEQQAGKIVLLRSGWEAQKLANTGCNVGVIGEYYYDTAEKNFTRHYSVVQPSLLAFAENGELQAYYRRGLLTSRKDVNNGKGLGTFLAQAGIAVGLIDFRWAYNRKMEGLLQLDKQGKIRGGILFIVFPDQETGDLITIEPVEIDATLEG